MKRLGPHARTDEPKRLLRAADLHDTTTRQKLCDGFGPGQGVDGHNLRAHRRTDVRTHQITLAVIHGLKIPRRRERVIEEAALGNERVERF